MNKKIENKIKKIETLITEIKKDIKNIETKKTIKKQNKVLSKFYYTIPSINNKSLHNYIVKTFGKLDKKLNTKVMKFDLEIDKKITYNKHSFELRYFDNRLILLIDDIHSFDWSVIEIIERSKLTTTLVKEALKQKKIVVKFNQVKKNHGTQFIIYK